MSLFIKLHGDANESQNQLSAKMFFAENNLNGYVTMPGFIAYLKTLSEPTLASLELFIEYLNERVRLNSLPIERLDRAGKPYIWTNFQMVNSTQGFKVVIVERLAEFIKDYQQGKITVNFTLEELVEVAEKGDSAQAA